MASPVPVPSGRPGPYSRRGTGARWAAGAVRSGAERGAGCGAGSAARSGRRRCQGSPLTGATAPLASAGQGGSCGRSSYKCGGRARAPKCASPPPAIPVPLTPPHLSSDAGSGTRSQLGTPQGSPPHGGVQPRPGDADQRGAPLRSGGRRFPFPGAVPKASARRRLSVRPCPCVSEQLRGCGWVLPGLLMRCRQPWVFPPHPAQGAVGQGQGWGRGGWKCRVQGEFGSDLHTGAVSRKATPL